MDKVQLEDFLDYHFLSSPSFAGRHVVFIDKKADLKGNRYNSDLMLMDMNGGIRRLTSCTKVTGYAADGGRILFTSTRLQDKEKSTGTDFFMIGTSGGEAEKAFSLDCKVMDFRFIDASRILVKYVGNAQKPDSGWHELEAYPFCMNGIGFISREIPRLAVYDMAEGKFTPVGPGNFKVESFFLSPDGGKVLAAGSCWRDHTSFFDRIYEIDLETSGSTCLFKERGWQVMRAVYLGASILVTATDMKKHGINQNPDFFKLEGGKLIPFKKWGEAVRSSVGSDCRLGGGPDDCVYDGRYYFTTTLMNHSCICSIDGNGRIFIPERREGSVDGFAIKDGVLVSVEMRDGLLQEIYVDGKRVSDVNTPFFTEKRTAIPQRIDYVNDGVELNGWVLEPIGIQEGGAYPAILDIHGGPKTVYGETYFHEMQYWAAKGYFVMFTNPRGSDGRGDDFADIRGKYGTVDFSDIMAFVDAVLEKYPQIDRKRLGATGGSYGGFMSNWILGHTGRFKAIATQRSISNWMSMWGTSDIGSFFVDDECGAELLKGEFGPLLEQSPLPSVIRNARTPTLILHSDEDYRCPVEQAYQLFAVLKEKRVPCKLVLFHGENHELSRSGKPKNRIKRLQEITAWMDRYL